MSHNYGCRRNRLRKGKRGITSSYWYGSRATYRPIYNKHRRTTPEWGALHRAWVGYVIAKSQDDLEKMRKYALSALTVLLLYITPDVIDMMEDIILNTKLNKIQSIPEPAARP